MKITAESKYEKGQEVFVIYCSTVVKVKISFIGVETWCREIRIKYECFGEYRCPGRPGRPGTILVGDKEYLEKEIYPTEAEAKAEIDRRQRVTVEQKMFEIKQDVCHVLRNHPVSEVKSLKLKKFVRACRKFNSELIEINKEIETEVGNERQV